MKGDFHVFTGHYLNHGFASVFGSKQAVVRRGEKLGRFPVHNRTKNQIAVPAIRPLKSRISTHLPSQPAIFTAPKLTGTRSDPNSVGVEGIDGDAVHTRQRQISRHQLPMRPVICAFPCTGRCRSAPDDLVIRSRLLNGVNMAGTRTLNLEIHRHFRVVTPRPHFFPDSRQSIRGSGVKGGVFMRNRWGRKFCIAHPSLVKLRVAVFNEFMRRVMRIESLANLIVAGFSAVHHLHPIRRGVRRLVRSLRDVLPEKRSDDKKSNQHQKCGSFNEEITHTQKYTLQHGKKAKGPPGRQPFSIQVNLEGWSKNMLLV